MFNKILLASDGSDGALKAAAATAQLAKAFGSVVTIVHVYMVPNTYAPLVAVSGEGLDPSGADRYAAQVQDAVARRTGRVLEQAGVSYETRLEIGHPPEVICDIADAEKYDLVVLGSRGLSKFRSFFLGSVSDRVSHHARCPVLIVK